MTQKGNFKKKFLSRGEIFLPFARKQEVIYWEDNWSSQSGFVGENLFLVKYFVLIQEHLVTRTVFVPASSIESPVSFSLISLTSSGRL